MVWRNTDFYISIKLFVSCQSEWTTSSVPISCVKCFPAPKNFFFHTWNKMNYFIIHKYQVQIAPFSLNYVDLIFLCTWHYFPWWFFSFCKCQNGFYFDPCRLGVPVYILVVDTFSAQADLNVNRLITRSVVHLGTSPAHGGQIVKKSS